MSYQSMHKLSRLRRGPQLRALVRETRLSKEDLVMPLFFKEGKGAESIASMPGIMKMPVDALLKEVEKLQKLGLKAVLLFGSSSRKDDQGTAGFDPESAFHKALRKVRQSTDMVIMADVCLCAYTDHGHCGIVQKSGPGSSKDLKCGSYTKGCLCIDQEKTLEALAKIALSYAHAGVDMVAPSAMADNQVEAIRNALDESGFLQTSIMSYSAKYASSFYGPFRDIFDSNPVSGDRRCHQMDPANRREALREALADVEEGADIVMVKPALSYLDIMSAIRDKVNVLVAAYNVSGEYSMVKAASAKGWIDERAVALEMLLAMKRAGADIIMTYWAREAAAWI
ncbi:MAG: porphobilinogen synthase [Candidatus Omnitrophica bacterium]|nr:porphobilinogen synthase [Candidatus Omnitrophota bacterium]